MTKLLAQGQFGTVTNPFDTLNGPAGLSGSTSGSGLVVILGVFFKTAIVLAGVYTLFNLVFAGYAYMSAGGDPKAISKAWDKIWQSLVGLLIVAGSLVIAIIIGFLIFGRQNATILVSPQIFAPQ